YYSKRYERNSMTSFCLIPSPSRWKRGLAFWTLRFFFFFSSFFFFFFSSSFFFSSFLLFFCFWYYTSQFENIFDFIDNILNIRMHYNIIYYSKRYERNSMTSFCLIP